MKLPWDYRDIYHKNFMGNIAMVSIWFGLTLTQNNNLDMQSLTHLDIPTIKYKHFTGITILTPTILQVHRSFDWC